MVVVKKSAETPSATMLPQRENELAIISERETLKINLRKRPSAKWISKMEKKDDFLFILTYT